MLQHDCFDFANDWELWPHREYHFWAVFQHAVGAVHWIGPKFGVHTVLRKEQTLGHRHLHCLYDGAQPNKCLVGGARVSSTLKVSMAKGQFENWHKPRFTGSLLVVE